MKKLKALTGIIICILMILPLSATTYAINKENDDYKLLLEQGYEVDYINNLTDAMIAKMAETIRETSDPEYINDYDLLISKGIPTEFINSLTESSLKKMREVLEGYDISYLDYVSDNEKNNIDVKIKKLSVQLIDKSDSSVKGEVICAYWEWAINTPLIREEDYISAKWNQEVYCYDSDSFYAEDYKRNNFNSPWSVSDTYTALASITYNSLGHWAKIYGAKKQIGGFMIFSLVPTQPIDSATDYDRDIDIEYTHETKTTSTISMFIIFIVLVLSAIWIITEIKKRRR